MYSIFIDIWSTWRPHYGRQILVSVSSWLFNSHLKALTKISPQILQITVTVLVLVIFTSLADSVVFLASSLVVISRVHLQLRSLRLLCQLPQVISFHFTTLSRNCVPFRASFQVVSAKSLSGNRATMICNIVTRVRTSRRLRLRKENIIPYTRR